MKQSRVVIKASRGLQKALKPACTQRGKPLRLVAPVWKFLTACYGNLSRLAAIQGPFLYVKNKLVNERNRKMKLYIVK